MAQVQGAGSLKLHVEPLTLAQANELVSRWHRHHRKVVGHRFSIGCFDDQREPHGAAIIGRPVARRTEQYRIAEVTRLVTDGTPNACSLLYGAAARAAKAMGFVSIQTFILESEPGTSLRAAGWRHAGMAPGGRWSTPSRQRDDVHPLEPKAKYERILNEETAA